MFSQQINKPYSLLKYKNVGILITVYTGTTGMSNFDKINSNNGVFIRLEGTTKN